MHTAPDLNRMMMALNEDESNMRNHTQHISMDHTQAMHAFYSFTFLPSSLILNAIG